MRVEKAIRRRSRFNIELPKWFPINFCRNDLDPVDLAVSRRAKLFAKEHLLMKWYLLQSSKSLNDKPSPMNGIAH